MRTFLRLPYLGTALLVGLAATGCGKSNGNPMVTVDMSGNGGGDMTGTGTDDGGTGLVGECDPIHQMGCSDPNNPKCSVEDDGTMTNTLTETCVATYGTGALGAACMRHGGTLGLDDCMTGLFCSPFGNEADPTKGPVRFCRTFCTQDSDCTVAGQKCYNLVDASSTSDSLGVCAPQCTLFGTDCPTGMSCDEFFPDIDGMNIIMSCRATGTAMVGATCASDFDCPDLTGCVKLDAAAMGYNCLQYCDASHSCPTGKSCINMFKDSMGMMSPLGLPGDAGFCN
jgi:hypothetical protein